MKIHHYTSIETLEMILKNKSIKFNRLDHKWMIKQNINMTQRFMIRI